jgi:DNA-directed RNA polymerase subunit RPC12/RpoP
VQKGYYILIFNIEVKVIEGNAMFESKAFVCPYSQCRKMFRKALMLTDSSKIPRETYYACPHCLSRVDVAVDDVENVSGFSVKVSEGNGLSAVVECPHQFGYLKDIPKNAIPDECLACTNLIQCSA